MNAQDAAIPIDALDRRIIVATQEGLPLVPRPYHTVAEALGVAPEQVMARLARMLEAGIVRRMGAIPNHYRIGYRANGMSVWDVADEMAGDLGQEIGALDFVSHCYLRPRALPGWPYNLFAMVHGANRAEVERKRVLIAGLLGPCCRRSDILYSTRVLKKTGLRLKRKRV